MLQIRILSHLCASGFFLSHNLDELLSHIMGICMNILLLAIRNLLYLENNSLGVQTMIRRRMTSNPRLGYFKFNF